MRILVTGASGFVGRHLLTALQAPGFHLVPPVRLDVGPETVWDEALQRVEVVIHLAALAHERAESCERSGDYGALRRVNALGVEQLARAAAAMGVRHFIHLSTIGICGDETLGRPFTEESPAVPRSLYAKSKMEAEELLTAVASATGMPVTILRPTLVYGPGNGGNLLRLLELIQRGWPLPFGMVHNRRSLTYVGNLVSAIVSLLGRSVGLQSFVVCDAEPVSTPNIVRHLARGMGRRARLLPVPTGALRLAARALGKEATVRRLIASLEADCAKLTRFNGWRPSTPSEQGLLETGAWFGARN